MIADLRNRYRSTSILPIFAAVIAIVGAGISTGLASAASQPLPGGIRAIFRKPMYKQAVWGLRVVNLGTGKVLIDLKPGHKFFIGSVRKIFSVGELLNEVGPKHTFDTPVYRRGQIDQAGVLHGDLILVASGDLTMGGRTNPDGSIAVTDYDHNEADSLGNAVLSKPDPLAGYIALARQVGAAGIKKITGEIIIDDRLFQPFNFRHEFDVRPMFVNDDVVDVTINPGVTGKAASIQWRPACAAFGVGNRLMTGGPGSTYTVKLDPEFPSCIGQPGCVGEITGILPQDFVPPLTNKPPLVQTFRIVQPSNYARTVLIEALAAAGVKVDAAPVAPNPVKMLPPRNSYSASDRVAQLTGLPYSDDTKLILKVSYNIGADTSLVLFGLAHGVDNMSGALAIERQVLASRYKIPGGEFSFVDGSGGGPTTATNRAVTQMLAAMKASRYFPAFFNALPKMGIDGSLGFVKNFQSNSRLAGATGQVHAKTGTFVQGSPSGMVLKGQALAGYANTRNGTQLVFELVVNNVPVKGLNDLLQVFQDQGTIAAILWSVY